MVNSSFKPSTPLKPRAHSTFAHRVNVAPKTSTAKCRVMLVDDSLVVRGILRKILISDPDIEIVASVGNGKLAVEELDKTKVDAVILDIEMPIMDGITALPLMLKKKPDLVVLVASTLSQKNADISLKCMALGAKDYIPKPTTQSFATDENAFKRELISKIKTITQNIRDRATKKKIISSTSSAIKKDISTEANEEGFTFRPLPEKRPEAIVIGSSTGGPQALAEVLKNAKGRFKTPIFIAQHMPPLFTKSLAAHIERVSGMTAKEGEDGEVVKSGCIYVAPGDFHMEVISNGADKKIKLTQNPPENFCRPSVNPLLRSVARAYGGKSVCAMLTGLGSDGFQGAKEFINQGGAMIAQNKETCVVWGMPAAVTKAGYCSAVLPLNKISDALERITNTINPRFGVTL